MLMLVAMPPINTSPLTRSNISDVGIFSTIDALRTRQRAFAKAGRDLAAASAPRCLGDEQT